MQGKSSLQTLQDPNVCGESNLEHVLQTSVEDQDVKDLLHPAMDNQFKAVYTARDHNCLWNSICLCLGLPEDKQMDFRQLTVSQIFENEEHFKNLIMLNGNNETIQGLINACLQPNQYDGWGNDYHLLALAIGLNRNIYVYNSFRNNTGRFLQNARTNISNLAKMFANKVGGSLQHRNYQPTKGIESRSPLCLFFHENHYTALVPRVSDPIYCIPHHVILQSIDSHRQHRNYQCAKGGSNEGQLDMQNVMIQSNSSKKTMSQESKKLNFPGRKGQSKWSKWYNNLSTDEKKAYNQRKAKSKSADIKSAQNRKYYKKHANVIQPNAQKRQRESYANPVTKESKKAASKKRRKEMYADPQRKEEMKAESRKKQKQLYENHTTKEIKKAVSRKRQEIKRKNTKAKGKDIDYLLEQANLAMQEFPALACTVCHRARFKEQVIPCKRSRYSKTDHIQNTMTGDYVHRCDSECSDNTRYHKLRLKEWVCFTCDRHLKKGDVPPQAIVNGLKLDPIPEELKVLNPLERHLISIIQPFQKIVPLPKGGQKGVRGQMVCVPADLQKTADTLPWTPDTNSLIRVKLKRKLEYKGHHLFMTVSQDKIMKAVMKLKEINPHYKDIKINENWAREIIQRGYTQMVDELHIPTEEEQYEVHIENEREEHMLHTEACGQDMTTEGKQYEAHIANKKEDQLYTEASKHVDELQESWKIQREIEKETDNVLNVPEIRNETVLDLQAAEFDTTYEEETSTYLEKQFQVYMAEVEDSEKNAIRENSDSYVHPLDQNIEHPFQCSSMQQIDPSMTMSDGDILSIAPSEGKRPVHALHSESLCFPAIFPRGTNSYFTETETGDYIQRRGRDISVTKYFDSRVLSIDDRFQSDSEWIFYAQYLKEVEQVRNAATIAMKKGPGVTKQGKKITAGDLVDKDRLTKSVFRANLGYKSFKDIPGTPPYWENAMNGLFASFKQIGPPSFFISFSAADRRWPEIAQAILARKGKDVSTWDTLTWSEYCELINSSPVTAVQMFERRVAQFVKLMISECQPLGGKVLDCFLRREMQDRGSPHIHAMVWVDGSPKPEASDEEHIKFIEKAISCELPDKEKDALLYDIVTSVQRHSRNHSRTCFKNKTSECRFNYPLPIASSTYILRPGEPPKGIKKKEWQQNAYDLIKKIKDFLTQTLDLEHYTVQDVLSICGTTEEEYKEALQAICKRDQIVLKRNPAESWVNFYNRDLLKFWNGNMDIQYIYNPYACAKYCLSYIAKAEREMGDLMRKAQQEARAGNMDAMVELRHLGDIYLTHRSVSIMEAVYRLTQLPLKTFTRDVVFVPVDDCSYRFSLPLKILSQRNEKSSQIWTSNLLDKYLARPNSQVFNNMSLAEFAADYEKCPSAESRKQNVYKLQGDLGYVRKRGKRAIIRYFKANIDKDPERYYKNLIRLYLPHRILETFPPFETFEALFLGGTTKNSDNIVVNICDTVQENMNKFERNADLMEDSWEECVNNRDDHEFAWADLAPNAEEDRLNQIEEREEMEELDEEYIEDETVTQSFPQEASETQHQTYAIAKTPIMDTKELNEMIRKMNDQQYPFLMHIRNWCLQTIRGEKPDPFFIHLTGSAGTGKSHLVRSIYQLATKILQQMSDDTGEVVLLTSFTGSAAFNIGGYTIHNLFSIPLNAKLPYKGLKNDGLLESPWVSRLGFTHWVPGSWLPHP